MKRIAIVLLTVSIMLLTACQSVPTQTNEDPIHTDEEAQNVAQYSDFEMFTREEGSKGTRENPYRIDEDATLHIGYFSGQHSRHTGTLEIDISSVFTGNDVEVVEVLEESPINDDEQLITAQTNVTMVDGPKNVPYAVTFNIRSFNEANDAPIQQNQLDPAQLMFPYAIELNESVTETIPIVVADIDIEDITFAFSSNVDTIWFTLE